MDSGDKPTGNVRFTVLGPMRAWRDGQGLDLGPPQQRAMLAVLLLQEGRTATAHDLIDGVWGEEAPPRALGALRTYAFRLRRILETPESPPRMLISVGDGYALKIPDSTVDAAIFEDRVRAAEKARADGDLAHASRQLHEALEMWEGTPLVGVPGPFAQTHRTRLSERRLSALEARLELDLELRRHTDIVGELTALSSQHPLRERLRGLLMLALYRCGRQAEALAVFADARRTLVEELGIDPDPDLRNLHQRILEADPALAAPRTPADQATAAAAPHPAQLPSDVADFTGRAATVAELIDAVTNTDTSAVVVSAVAGIGGVGKTTTAVHVAHAVRDKFPDGQLYVDLQGVGRQPHDPGTVLAGFLRALGAADTTIPESLDERAALYRSTLAGRRVLVLLDNARDAEQLRPLLPGSPTCAVLVTSRARLAGLSGAHLVDLDILDPREALRLFTRIVGDARGAAERQAAMTVVAACGCLPLAVRIVASRLAARPNWSIASLADRLADERRRLAELRVGDLTVEATFRLGYDQLEPAHARAFRLLALPEGADCSLSAAAAVLELDAAEAEDILESLVDAAMLESPNPRRYRYHDLLRLFARERTEQLDSAADRAAVLHRLLDFCLASVRNAYQVVEPGNPVPGELTATVADGLSFADPDTARRWALAELTNILAVITQAAREPAVPVAVAADLVLGLEPFVDAGFHWRDIEPVARLVARMARERGDSRSEARALDQLVSALLELSRLDEAQTLARTVIELSRGADDVTLLLEALNAEATIAVRRRHYDRAISLYDDAITLRRQHGHAYYEAQACRGAAFAYIAQGCAAEAVPACERSLAIFRELGDDRGEAHTLYTLGLAFHRLGRLAEADTHFGECLALCRFSGQRSWEAYALFRMADVALDAGRPAEAVTSAEHSLALSRELHEDYNQARVLTVLGRALTELHQSDRSQACLREAYEIFTRLDVPDAEDVRPLLRDPDLVPRAAVAVAERQSTGTAPNGYGSSAHSIGNA